MAARFTVTWTNAIRLIEGGRWVEPFEFVDENGEAASLAGVSIRVRIGTSLESPGLLEATSDDGDITILDQEDPANVGKAELDVSIASLSNGPYLVDIVLFFEEVPFAYARGPLEIVKLIPEVAA